MEKKRAFYQYSLFVAVTALLLSAYPLYMGMRVMMDMAQYGTVYAEEYPKYIIPYTPISIAFLLGTALMPLLISKCCKAAFAVGALASLVTFFAVEVCLERLVTVTKTVEEVVSSLENWQMYMCYVPPDAYETRQWTEVNVLLGEYSPAFKLHFYLISVILLITLLNAVYGFARMIYTGNKSRKKALSIQSVTAIAFLLMCVWACFTAFYRNGEITVSPLSALLMSVFFILFGMTAGLFAGSFLLKKGVGRSVILPSGIALCITLIMYLGEMILLNGNLYRFGHGVLFDGLPYIVMAPIDFLIVLCSGISTAGICYALNREAFSIKC